MLGRQSPGMSAQERERSECVCAIVSATCLLIPCLFLIFSLSFL